MAFAVSLAALLFFTLSDGVFADVAPKPQDASVIEGVEKLDDDNAEKGFLSEPRRLQSASKKSGSLPWWIALPLLGCACWVIIPFMLYHNERLAVKKAKFVKKARDRCIIIDNPYVEPPKAMIDHVVYVKGITTTTSVLQDDIFPMITAQNAVRLHRRVEMYQCTKREKKDGQEKIEYGWRESRVDIASNPPMPIPSSSRLNCTQAEPGSIKLGVYYCGAFVRRDIKNWVSLKPGDIQEHLDTCPALQKLGLTKVIGVGENWTYFGQDPNPRQPKVGLIRVSFEVLTCGPLSVISVLEYNQGWSFVPLLHEDEERKFCDELKCSSNKDNLHWTGRPEDVPALNAALEKMENELTDKERDALKAQLLRAQSKDIDGNDIVGADSEVNEIVKPLVLSMIGRDDFCGVQDKHMEFQDMVSKTQQDAHQVAMFNRILFTAGGIASTMMILSPIMWILSIPICYGWGYYVCYSPGLPYLLLICCCGTVCSLTFTSVIMAVSWIRFRPLLSTCLACAAIAGITFLTRMTTGAQQ